VKIHQIPLIFVGQPFVSLEDFKGRKNEFLPRTDDDSGFHRPESVPHFVPCYLQSNHAFALLDRQILP
jgi:hypothetical protein